METGMIIISTLLIGLCALPFVLLLNSAKRKAKQIKKGIKKAIAKDNGKLTDYVIHNNFAIGLDGLAKHVYFYKKTTDEDYFKSINCNETSTCTIKKETKQIKSNTKNYELIQSLALVFTYHKNATIEEFELFNCAESAQLTGEIALAELWRKKVMNLISKHPITSLNSDIVKPVSKSA